MASILRQCLVAGSYSEVRDLASASPFKVWLTSDIPMTQQVGQIQQVPCYPCATPGFSMVVPGSLRSLSSGGWGFSLG